MEIADILVPLFMVIILGAPIYIFISDVKRGPDGSSDAGTPQRPDPSNIKWKGGE